MAEETKTLCTSCASKKWRDYCKGLCGIRVADASVCDTCPQCFEEPCEKCGEKGGQKYGTLCDECAMPGLSDAEVQWYDAVCEDCGEVFSYCQFCE